MSNPGQDRFTPPTAGHALSRCWILGTSVFAGLVALLLMLASPGLAATNFSFTKKFGPDGTAATGFAGPTAVGVDEGADLLYVLDSEAGTLYKFDLEGHPVAFGGSSPQVSGNELTGLATTEDNGGERGVAVNPTTHAIYLTGHAIGGGSKAVQAFHQDGDPAIFSAGEGAGTNEIPGFVSLRSLAVDQNGAIYTGDWREIGKHVQVYRESGSLLVPQVGTNPIEAPESVAVDSRGVVNLIRGATGARKYTPSQFPVTAATTYGFPSERFDPNQAISLAVDRASDDVYVAEGAPGTPRIAAYDKEGTLLGTFAGPGQPGELIKPSSVAALSVEELPWVFASDHPNGQLSQVKVFRELPCTCPPTIESTSVSDVTGDSAILRAKIDTRHHDTTYWFEYGPGDCASGPCEKVPAEGVSIPAGAKPVAVQFALAGLQPATTYHFRVVAENAEFTEPGPDRTFTTQAPGFGAVLSDSRAWELVSPAQKSGGVPYTSASTAIEAASAGGKLAYAGNGSLLGDPISNRAPETATLVAERGPNGEWANRELTPAHTETSHFVHGPTEFKLFTPDLLHAVMDPSEDTPLSPEATQRTPYLWSDGTPPSFTPLLTPANVPPGTVTDPEPSEANRVRIAGASPDLSVVAVESKPPLVPGASEDAVYAWSNGTLEPISQLPAGEGGAVVKGTVGTGKGSVRHAISDDGSRVFWSLFATTDQFAGLYLRDRSAGESVRLDIPQPGASGEGNESPSFAGASADGSVAFFTDSRQLTADASQGEGARDLYRCQIGPVEEGLGCAELTDLSAPPGAESAEVLDQLPAISEDGKRLFFVARGVLDEEANERGATATAGQPNLYYWAEGQPPRFVATLSKEDSLVWGISKFGEAPLSQNISAALSPDGRYLAFTSEQSLTGYENRNAAEQANSEVFLYDTEAAGDRLTCISCNPSGAGAVGRRLPEKEANFPPDPGGIWEGRHVAATLPQATQTEASGSSFYRPRTVLDNGRVFFNSVDPLVAADSNGRWDVYEYEPVGVGSCTAATNEAAATRTGAGCLGLVSSGTAEADAGFLDASANGTDAFLLTAARLSVSDRDEEMDVYDARVDGITAVLHPVQECLGEACQSAPAAPNDPTPASESFNGAGSPLICPKGQRKARRQGREVCVAKKRHRHKKGKRAHHKAKR